MYDMALITYRHQSVILILLVFFRHACHANPGADKKPSGSKEIYYRSYKNFNESDFLCNLKKSNCDFLKNDPMLNYNLSTNKFLGIVNKHDPLKKKFVRGNNEPFMNREFDKEFI